MWHAHDRMGWWMAFGMAIWLLVWVSMIYLFFYALAHREHSHEGPGGPMDVAKHRLARGEITPDQFQEIARHLQPPAGQSP